MDVAPHWYHAQMDYLSYDETRARLADIITRSPGDGRIRATLGGLLHGWKDADEVPRIGRDETDAEILARLSPDHPRAAVFAHLGGGGNL